MMNAKKALRKSMLNREYRAICDLKDAIQKIKWIAGYGNTEYRMRYENDSDEFVISRLRDLGYTVIISDDSGVKYIEISWRNAK